MAICSGGSEGAEVVKLGSAHLLGALADPFPSLDPCIGNSALRISACALVTLGTPPLAVLENGGSAMREVFLSNKLRAAQCHQLTHFAESMGH